MIKSKFIKEKEVALQCAMAASSLCQMIREEMVTHESIIKEDKSPVTVADYGSQAVICHMLREHFPNDPIVAEETSIDLKREENGWILSKVTSYVRNIFYGVSEMDVCEWIDIGKKEISQRYWCIDPIDGTKGFLRGDQYAIAIALVVDGSVRIGVLACPNLPEDLKRPNGPRGVIFFAEKGEGAFQRMIAGGEESRISVSRLYKASDLRFCESFEPEHSNHQLHLKIARKLGINESSIRMDSQAKYGIVARGDASIYLRLPSIANLNYKEKVWDHAAGAIIIEEAGGEVTDARGRPIDFGKDYKLLDNIGIVATNGTLHQAVLSEIANEIIFNNFK
jgi:3'(2'), 5'-bisphosphate nucleotidase